MADEKIALELETKVNVDEKQAEESGRRAGKIHGKGFEKEVEKSYKRTQLLGQRYSSKGGLGTPGIDVQLKGLAKGFKDNVKEIYTDLKNFRLEETANNGLGLHSALTKSAQEMSKEAELFSSAPKLRDLLDTKLEFKDTPFEGFFSGSILEGKGKQIVNLFRDSETRAKGLSRAIDTAAVSEEKLKTETVETVRAIEKLGSSKFADILFRGTNAAKKNASIAATRERVRSLEPTAEDYKNAAVRLNVGRHSNKRREEVKAARERIKAYEAELAALKKLENAEDSQTGGLFSNRFKKSVTQRLGVLSDKNSIFDKKTIEGNGILSAAGFRALRLAEIGFKGATKSAKAFGSAISKITIQPILSPLKKLSSWIKDFGKRFRNKLIRNAITAVINLAKEGFKNLNAYSQMIGTPFHQNVIKLQSSLVYLKNAFAAMVGPIVNAVTPALETLMDTIAELANKIGAFFAAITGQSQFSAALKKTVSDVSSAAGKMKDLFGFDDLNRLSGDSGSASSWEGAFEEWNPNEGIFGKFKQFVDNKQWEELGASIADKLNGLVSGFDADGLGSKIARKINNAVKIAKGFITETNFSAIGDKLAGFVNGLMDINTEDAANTLTKAITGLFDIGLNFLEKLDWGKVGSAIGGLIKGAFEALTNWIKDKDWEQIGANLITKLADAIRGFDVGGTAGKIFEFLKGVFEAAFNLLKGIVKGLWNEFIAPVIEDIILALPDGIWWLLQKAFGIGSKEDAIASLYFDLGVKPSSVEQSKVDVTLTHGRLKQIAEDPLLLYEKEDTASAAKAVTDVGNTHSRAKSAASEPILYSLAVKAADKVKQEAKSISEDIEEFFTNPITYILKPWKGYGEIVEEAKNIQEKMQNSIGPLYLAMSFATSGLTSKLAYVWEVLQRALYNSPLQMPTVITNSAQQTFAGKALIANTRMASGGSVPNIGSLILAGEAGPEIVANMGNRTGVMNIDQMEQAVSNGNVDVVNAVYAMANMLVSAVNNKDLDVYMDSAKVGQAVTRYQNNQSRRGIQGAY